MTKKISKKRRRHSIMAFEMVRLDRAAAEPLHQQLYRQIRDELVSGKFQPQFLATSFFSIFGRRPGNLAADR